MRIGVSGANGFVGRAFVKYLRNIGDQAAIFTRGQPMPSCEVFVHIAGLAHKEASILEFMRANCDMTVDLATMARDKGVKRIVFVSSISVVSGHKKQPLTPDMSHNPTTDYGRSKAAAEQALSELTGIETVVVRPPLVFGKGAKGNLAALMKVCASGAPLPFASINNRRSMIGISNLCSALHFLCKEDVKSEIFHVKDEDFSISSIVSRSRAAMGMKPRLFPVPPSLLRLALTSLGRKHMASQLIDDLIIDDSSLRIRGWNPEFTTDLDEMAYEARA